MKTRVVVRGTGNVGQSHRQRHRCRVRRKAGDRDRPRSSPRHRRTAGSGIDVAGGPTAASCAIDKGVIVDIRETLRLRREVHSSTAWVVLLGVIVLGVMAGRAADAALTPVGDTFEVSTGTDDTCVAPRVSMRSDGGFHVVWQEYDPASAASSWDVRGRSFDANDVALGDEHVINGYTLGFQESPTVAVADGGEFVVAWSGVGDGDPYGAFARVHEADGTPKTDDVPLHEGTPGVYERTPSVAADGDEFVVAWVEDVRVAGVHVDVTGATKAPFENAVDEPNRVAVDDLPGGEFVVVWSSSQYASDNVAYGETGRVEGRVFAEDGTGGDGFEVNASRDDPTGYGFVVDGAQSLAVSADAAGNFVAGHDSYVPSYVYNVDEQVDGYNLGAKTERFVGGTSQGAEFVASEPATVVAVDVAVTPGGNVVMVHEGDDILARARDCHGSEISNGDVDVDGDSTLGGGNAAVAVNESGDVVVVWEQRRESGNGAAIVGRRFLLTAGCALCGDADKNGRVTAVDALAALQTSVGLGTCVLARCDTDASLAVTATDALRILGASVDSGPPALSCVAAGS